MTDVLPIADAAAINRAAQVIEGGGLVVLPTDTVYGVGASVWNAEAVLRIYAAKQRPPEKAIPVLLSDAEQITQIAVDVPPAAERLTAAFWPGSLTLVVPKRASVPDAVSSLPTIGVRVPDHDAARALITACSGALAVTSANISDQPPAQTAEQAVAALGGRVDLILDGGRCPGGVPSTVAALHAGGVTVLREGPVFAADLLRALKA